MTEDLSHGSTGVLPEIIGQDSTNDAKCITFESVNSLGEIQDHTTTAKAISISASPEFGSDKVSNSAVDELSSKSHVISEKAELQTPVSDLRCETLSEPEVSDCVIVENPPSDDVHFEADASDCITIEDDTEVAKVVGTEMPNDLLQSDTSAFSMVQVVESVEDESSQGSSSASDSENDSSDSDSSVSSDETSSDSDSCDLAIRHKEVEFTEEIAALKNSEPPKVKGELSLNELPPVDDLNILLPEDAVLEVIGKVAHIMPDHSVIIQSYLDKPALDFETVLFLSRESAIGKVEETFGPVPSPFYVIRFNSEEHLLLKGVELNMEVSYAPHIQDFTSFVFVSALRSIRGSDASWCNDQEPPPSCLDYSDDEQEREARRRKKNDGAESESKHKKPVPRNGQEIHNARRGNRPRGRGRDRWHNESTRFNVSNMPDPSQAAWQSAVSGMSRQGSERLRPPIPPPPPDLLNCFQRPPEDPPEYLRPHPAYVGLGPPEDRPPPYHWGAAHLSYMPQSMFGFPPPPPPPPP